MVSGRNQSPRMESKADPVRELVLNAVSLACGFVGNFFLLCNFTKRVRYIISLPMSIIFWFFATGIVCFHSRLVIFTNEAL